MNKQSVQMQVGIIAILTAFFFTSFALTAAPTETKKIQKKRVQASSLRNIKRNPIQRHSFEKANESFRTFDSNNNSSYNSKYLPRLIDLQAERQLIKERTEARMKKLNSDKFSSIQIAPNVLDKPKNIKN